MVLFEFENIKYKGVLDIPSLKINKGEITAITGRSGSGKTALLKIMNKMLSPTEGKILYKGFDIKDSDAVLHRRKIVMLSQNPAIFESNIKDNLLAGVKFQNKFLPDDNLLEATLKKVKLEKPLDSSIANLSGGEKQRLALGRILLLDPEVYLLDEPSSALDDETANLVIDMIVDYARSGKKDIIMVTHSKAIAEKYSDNIIEIINGAIYGGAG